MRQAGLPAGSTGLTQSRLATYQPGKSSTQQPSQRRKELFKTSRYQEQPAKSDRGRKLAGSPSRHPAEEAPPDLTPRPQPQLQPQGQAGHLVRLLEQQPHQRQLPQRAEGPWPTGSASPLHPPLSHPEPWRKSRDKRGKLRGLSAEAELSSNLQDQVI